jgi:hypothetical protein
MVGMPVIPALGGASRRIKNFEFSLGYMASSRQAVIPEEPNLHVCGPGPQRVLKLFTKTKTSDLRSVLSCPSEHASVSP